MKNYFETKARYTAVNESGLEKIEIETNLFESETFADAEQRSYEVLKGYNNVEVIAIKHAKFNEVLRDDNLENGKWYQCKLNFITLDEKTGTEKFATQTFLVQADNIDDSQKRVNSFMSQSICDYKIESVKETKINDVIDY